MSEYLHCDRKGCRKSVCRRYITALDYLKVTMRTTVSQEYSRDFCSWRCVILYATEKSKEAEQEKRDRTKTR